MAESPDPQDPVEGGGPTVRDDDELDPETGDVVETAPSEPTQDDVNAEAAEKGEAFFASATGHSDAEPSVNPEAPVK